MTIEEQKLKLDLTEYIGSFFTDKVWIERGGDVIGYIPDDIVERMTEAAFNVLMTVKSTNKYRDENT